MGSILKIKTDANYEDHRNLLENVMNIWSFEEEEPNKISFELNYKGREDDTLIIECDVVELLTSIGKAIVNKD